MNEMPGIEIPAVPPGQGWQYAADNPELIGRTIALDTESGVAVDVATGEAYDMRDGQLVRRCAYVGSYECRCDDPAQCPVLREHPAEAAAELTARRLADADANPFSMGQPAAARYRDQGELGINLPPGQQTYTGPPVADLRPDMTQAEIGDAVTSAAREAAAGGGYMEVSFQPGHYPTAPPPARPLTPNGRPQLIHSGSYGLYLTPGGDYHLVYQRTAGTNPDTGEVLGIDGSPQVHLRDLPERAASMVMAIMDPATPLPPMIESLIFGGTKPNLRAILGAIKSADVGDLMKMAGDGSDG